MKSFANENSGLSGTVLRCLAATLMAGSLLIASAGCLGNGAADNSEGPVAAEPMPAPAPVPAQTPGVPGPGQTVFETDQMAADALVAAAKAEDHDQIHQILGPAWKELLSGDKVEDANDFKAFSAHAAEHMQLDRKDSSTTILDLGNDNWPFPIPIVRTPDGKWFFDTEAGKAEVLARRVGENELDTIDVCRAYVRAQRNYAREDHDGSDVVKYAQRIFSTPGRKDGLYWPVESGQRPSPFGRLAAEASMEGYEAPSPGNPHPPYHGYHFRILKRQGPSAPGGAYSYIINGNMVAGFALIAFPDKYGSSGIMTFIVNQRGKVYQKDLGPDSTDISRHIDAYNPDSTWTLVPE